MNNIRLLLLQWAVRFAEAGMPGQIIRVKVRPRRLVSKHNFWEIRKHLNIAR